MTTVSPEACLSVGSCRQYQRTHGLLLGLIAMSHWKAAGRLTSSPTTKLEDGGRIRQCG